MRQTLLASAALFGLAVAGPAFAQTTTPNSTTPNTGTSTTMPANNSEMTGQSQTMMQPHHVQASNIVPADTHSDIAPALPVPPIGPNASPEQYLNQARIALQHHRSGEAQEALERAETRMLDRSTTPSMANEPDQSPRIQQVTQALDALGHRDWQHADQIIAGLLSSPNMASGNGGMMHNADMTNSEMTGSGMNGSGMNTKQMNAGGMAGSNMNGGAGSNGSIGANGTGNTGNTNMMGSTPSSSGMSAPPAANGTTSTQ